MTTLTDSQRDWIAEQRVFFVASAPLTADGHVNCSPKGLDTFRVLDAATVGWLDLTGSGAETLAHIQENGRVVVMFCAFDGPPQILRLHGRGEVVYPGSGAFETWRPRFPEMGAVRSIQLVHIQRIARSCGFGVPLMEYRGERPDLPEWAERKGAEGAAAYQQRKNLRSIDGLPGVPAAPDAPDTPEAPDAPAG